MRPENGRQQGLADLVMRAKIWVKAQPPGEFSAFVFGKELSLDRNPEVRDMVLRDLVTIGLIEPLGNRRGQYRTVQSECREMDWVNAQTDYYPIWLPLGIHEICGVQKKNVIIVAGETNSGKTAFVMEAIHRNLSANGGEHDQILLFNSEMGDGELRQRVLNINRDMSTWTGFKAYERTRDFHQIIDSDGFNVIDYLEVSSDFFRVAEWIQRIHEKLNEGIAIICLQKPKGKDVGRGGDFSLEKSRLAISLFQNHGVHSCKIVKCKLPLEVSNPQGMECDYHIEHGASLKSRTGWRYLTNKEREDLWTLYEAESAARATRKELGF